jgi:hypothetical protein
MGHEDIQQLVIESQWIRKIALIVNNGGLEKLRQSGLYLDTHTPRLHDRFVSDFY